MSYAKLGTEDLTIPAKSLYLRRLAAGVTGNPSVPAPTPTGPVLLAAADGLDLAYNEAQAARLSSKSKTGLLDELSATANLLISQLASSVDAASGGNAGIIESTGFATRATPQPVGELAAPTDLQVVPSERAGSADASWKSGRGAVAFTLERAEDAPVLDFRVIGNGTKKLMSFNSMVSGKKYWHRVAAIGTAGQSPWSDAVPLFAP